MLYQENKEYICIGTVKGLVSVYGIDIILKAARIVHTECPNVPLRVRIAGKEWRNMGGAVMPSRQEAFGVSAVEARACGTLVIISDIPGLKEATCPFITSLLISQYTVNEFANGIIKLYDHTNLIERMRSNEVKYANKKFEYEKCFRRIETNLERYR